ncbi:multidrug effflux MFS transporter [Mycobacterium sp. Y57]|uniref:multidrug effflux MFS transporter n=1 Tax=Mycolicibacterium xanthum TaxID=2796469 RepID=UPI001C84D88E|nr:multidrug effflux MFS transporter [Mycolicibacterium xanthum]MBX7432228.1 multidrug effflux MFS transporter [Mycolicibacterium xanthum]
MTTTVDTPPRTASAPRISLGLLATLALLSAVAPFTTDLYLPGFPQMVTDLHTSPTAVQLTLTACLLGLAVGQLVFGPLSDRIGRVRPLIAGSAICVLASLAAVLAPTVEVLVAARFLQGLTGAAGMVIGRAIISDLATGRAAARAFSLMMLVGGLAPIVAPLAGGFIVGPLGWRGALAVILVLSVAMFGAVLAVIRETHTAQRRATLRDERVAAGSPLRDLTRREFVGHLVAFGFSFAMMMAYISASPFVYQTMMGLTSAEYGAMFGTNALGLLLMSALSARLTTRFEPRSIAGVGLTVILASSVAALTLASAPAGAGWLAVPLFTGVAGMGLIYGNTTALALAAVPRAAGTASAVLGAAQFLLAALVSPLVGLGGEHTAVPLGVVMVASAVVACTGFTLARHR